MAFMGERSSWETIAKKLVLDPIRLLRLCTRVFGNRQELSQSRIGFAS
jgi:hypothetical protein